MSDEARSMWERFITAPKNAALLKRYAKSAKEPAPLFESIGEDLASSNEEVRKTAFWALVMAMPELTNILHERETRLPGWRDGRGKDQQMVNRGSDILSYLHRVLVKEHRFKVRDGNKKDPRPFLKETVDNWKKDRDRKIDREVSLDYEAALEILDPAGSVEDRVTKEEVLHRFSDYHWIGLDLSRLSHYNFEDYSATPTLLLRKDYLKEEFRERKLDLASLQALRKIGESAEKLKLSKDISDEKKVEVIHKTASHVQDIFEACQKGIPFEEALRRKVKTLQPKKGEIFRYRPKQEKAVQPPDLSKIPLWRGRGLDGRALDYLKTHYGQYLSTFGAEQNSVFQDQIRAHDPKLMQDLRSQLHEEGRGRKVSDFVKPRSARTERELETFDLDILKQAERIKGLLRRGRLKKEDLETFDLDILKQAERIKGLLKRRRHKEADT
jgi:hypothetical protein